MEHIVKNFLTPYEGPFLLGLSGGPDSMALFHLLKKLSIPFEVAHVDHGWRIESKQEARQIRKWVDKVPFHLLTLKMEDFKGNLEEEGRLYRLRFFKEIAHKIGAKAVLLAHHKDDLAETVLKKIFEGVAPYAMGAILPAVNLNGLLVLRPFLSFTKQEIMRYLDGRPFIQDKTNLSPHFLRGRMRSDLIPLLSEKFGKNISPTLCRLHDEALELDRYLERRIKGSLDEIVVGPFGAFLDLQLYMADPYELKVIIHKFLRKRGLPCLKGTIEGARSAILKNKADVQVGPLRVDRGIIFHLNGLFTEERPVVQKNKHFLGPWKIEVLPYKGERRQAGWKQVWTGEASIIVDSSEFQVAYPKSNELFLGKNTLSKWWGNHKVPSFLSQVVPVLYVKNEPKHEFLTHKVKKPSDPLFRVLLKYSQV